jgi:hypothetical protein
MSYSLENLQAWDSTQSGTDTDRLNILNAVSQGSKPSVMYESSLMELLSPSSLVKVLNYTNFGLVKNDLDNQNVLGVTLWADALLALSLITSDESQAIKTYAQRTEPDHTLSLDVWGVSSTTQADLDRARGIS